MMLRSAQVLVIAVAVALVAAGGEWTSTSSEATTTTTEEATTTTTEEATTTTTEEATTTTTEEATTATTEEATTTTTEEATTATTEEAKTTTTEEATTTTTEEATTATTEEAKTTTTEEATTTTTTEKPTPSITFVAKCPKYVEYDKNAKIYQIFANRQWKVNWFQATINDSDSWVDINVNFSPTNKSGVYESTTTYKANCSSNETLTFVDVLATEVAGGIVKAHPKDQPDAVIYIYIVYYKCKDSLYLLACSEYGTAKYDTRFFAVADPHHMDSCSVGKAYVYDSRFKGSSPRHVHRCHPH